MVEGTNNRIETVKAKIEAGIEEHFREDEITQSKFVEAFKDFNSQIRQKLANLTQGLTEIQEMFTTFEAAHKTKVGEITVFESGLQAYKELLSFDADRIMNQLETDLNRIKNWIKTWQTEK